MAPIINVSDEVLEGLKKLRTSYKLVEISKPTDNKEKTPRDYQINHSDFIILEGKNSGKDSYPDLLVCKYRLGLNDSVKSAGQILGITPKNSAQERNERDYVGNINREQALKLNLLLGGRTLNIRQAKDFFKLILSEKAFDGKGKKIDKLELSQIINEIFEIRTNYRAEWFEDYFTSQQDNLILNKNYFLEKNVLVPNYSHNLTTCLMKDELHGIKLKGWLKDATAQGFPRKNVKSGKLFYWYPRKDKAVRFDAGPVAAILSCYRNPRGAFAWLGVRHVREAHAKN